jgi:phosphate transport system permease protein
MNRSLYARRRLTNSILLTLSLTAAIIGMAWLALILGSLIVQGFSGFSWTVFTQDTPAPGSPGGLANAIWGSIFMSSLAVAVGTPIGILAGTYLAEYGRHKWLAFMVRFVNDIMLSAPSILIGMFIYQVTVVNIHHFAAWAGALALAVIVFPVVARTTENMLLLVPNTLREAAAALGTPRHTIIRTVTWRAARAGIVTGVLLAVARISGETAPLLFTAFGNQFWIKNPIEALNSPMAALPLVIYSFANSAYDDWHKLAWEGALLITFAVLALSIIARAFESRRYGQ